MSVVTSLQCTLWRWCIDRIRGRFLGNLFYLNVTSAAALLMPLVLVPVLAHTLPADGLGEYLAAVSLLQLCQHLSDYSFNVTATRAVAGERVGGSDEQYHQEVQATRFWIGMVGVALGSWYASRQFVVLSWGSIALWGAVAVVGHVLASHWYYAGRSDLRPVAFVTVTCRIIGVLGVCGAVWWVPSPSVALAGFALATAVGGVYLSPYPVARSLFAWPTFRLLREGWDVFIGFFSCIVSGRGPMLLLAAYGSPAEVAIFGVADQVATMVGSLLDQISRAGLPLVSGPDRSRQRARALLMVQVGASVAVGFATFLTAGILPGTLFPPSYAGVAGMLRQLAVGVACGGIVSGIMYAYYLPRQADRHFRRVSLLWNGITLLVLLFFIPEGGAVGAVHGVVISGVVAVVLFALGTLFLPPVQRADTADDRSRG